MMPGSRHESPQLVMLHTPLRERSFSMDRMSPALLNVSAVFMKFSPVKM